MIIGIGTDIVDINRIKILHEKQGEKFLQRVLSEQEITTAFEIKTHNAQNFYNFIAKRFAAKEAIAKALGVGIGQHMKFTDATISNNEKGGPVVELSGCAEHTARGITPVDTTYKIDISLSDEPPMALAFVVISAS